jgi:hypothetical protein
LNVTILLRRYRLAAFLLVGGGSGGTFMPPQGFYCARVILVTRRCFDRDYRIVGFRTTICWQSRPTRSTLPVSQYWSPVASPAPNLWTRESRGYFLDQAVCPS